MMISCVVLGLPQAVTNALFATWSTGLVRYQIAGNTHSFYKRLTDQEVRHVASTLHDRPTLMCVCAHAWST